MNLKRLTSLVLAVSTVFCISASAMAADPAQTQIAKAREIAYMDVDAAPAAMREAILDAREVIINSQCWVADGYRGYYTAPDGTETEVPHFSELFPGWDLPAVDVSNAPAAAGAARMQPEETTRVNQVYLKNPSSSQNTPSFDVFYFMNELQTTVTDLDAATRTCTVGYSNMFLGVSVGVFPNMRVGSLARIENTPEDVAAGNPTLISVRASTNSTPGYGTFESTCW
ncbi:hypothetical protein [Oscillibacter sp.]|jgi:hypothetical protein|nr:hypothetical protein [Oscillibacter sp.]MCI9649974.1 hypothetical protein [Oscillibacter sp.]